MSDWLEIAQVPLLRMIAVPFETKPSEPEPVADASPPVGKAESISGYPVLDEFEATVIQPRLDLLDDNSWTMEPKPKPNQAITQAPLSIHDLVKRGAAPVAPASQPPPSKLPARPALVRPTAAKFDFTKNLAQPSNASAATQEVQVESAPRPARQIPAESSPSNSQAAPSSPPPAEIAATAHLASKAPPKPPSSTSPPASESQRTKAQPPPRVRTSAAVAREVPRTPARSATVSRSPSPSRSTVSTPAQSIAHAPTRPPISTSVQSATSAPTHLPASPPAPLPFAVQSANTSQAPYSGSVTPDPAEPIGSLFPSVSTIYPDMPEWRKSRRPLVVALGAVAAVAAAIFISFGVSHKKAEPTRPVAARVTAAAASELPAVAPSATANVLETVAEQAPVARAANTPEQKATPSSGKSSKRATSMDIAPTTESVRSTRKQVRESEPPVANRQLSEPKAATSESSTPTKSTTPSTKKVNSSSSSVASWDQGTVEHRTWMNPGF